jgi:hypothetical protein
VTETPRDLAQEAQEGRSPRTPAIALGVVVVTLAVFVLVILAAVLIVYYATK